jgi:hypothetical protein
MPKDSPTIFVLEKKELIKDISLDERSTAKYFFGGVGKNLKAKGL